MTPDELRVVAAFCEALDEWTSNRFHLRTPLTLDLDDATVDVAVGDDGKHYVEGVR